MAFPYHPLLRSEQAPLPQWAQFGNFVFMGLDGGPLEVEKGIRTGWPGFTRDDPQGIMRAIHDFYRPENVEIPLAAGANWVYLTWTNGWSKQRERRDQWPRARRFLEECRKHGIRCSAYISGANMFWQDYLEQIPESKKWIDAPEPSAIRHYSGQLYRVMANIRLREWRDQIRESIDEALDAGFEGFWVDNLFWWHGESLVADFLAEMRAHAARKRSDVVWHVNVNTGICDWGRVGNIVGTEDGKAPHFVREDEPPVDGNLGLLSLVSGLREGWRSAIMEHYGNDLPPEIRQLIIAECWMWHTGATWFPDSYLLPTQWHRREPAAWRVLTAMGTYNRHFLKYREYFEGGSSLATVGVIGVSRPPGERLADQKAAVQLQAGLVKLLNELASRNLQLEVLFGDRLNLASMRQFQLLIVDGHDSVPATVATELARYSQGGGTIMDARAPGVSRRSFCEDVVRRDVNSTVQANAPREVVWRAVRRADTMTVQLVNYSTRPLAPFALRIRGAPRSAEALIPEVGGPRTLGVRQEGLIAKVTVPDFPIHCLIRFQL